MNSEIKSINTRQNYDVNLIAHKNNFSKVNTINYKVGTCWNELPAETKMLALKTLPTFVKSVKNIYLSKYCTNCSVNNCYSCQ